jgi:hypothetical protein
MRLLDSQPLYSPPHLSIRSCGYSPIFVKTSGFFSLVFPLPPPQESGDDHKPLDVTGHHEKKPHSRHFRSTGCGKCEAKESEDRSDQYQCGDGEERSWERQGHHFEGQPLFQFPVGGALVALVSIDQGGETQRQPCRAAEYSGSLSHN